MCDNGNCECGACEKASKFSLADFIRQQKDFSLNAYGPGVRTDGVLKHIRKELLEIEADPFDLTEWIDVLLLTLDGTWRHGFEPEEVVLCLENKLAINKQRKWPDWRTVAEGESIHHIKEEA